jgi:hypothetical protein
LELLTFFSPAASGDACSPEWGKTASTGKDEFLNADMD